MKPTENTATIVFMPGKVVLTKPVPQDSARGLLGEDSHNVFEYKSFYDFSKRNIRLAYMIKGAIDQIEAEYLTLRQRCHSLAVLIHRFEMLSKDHQVSFNL
jgi:hypothetical protein